MNHTIMPVTAQGEPIPLIKLGQGRGDEHEMNQEIKTDSPCAHTGGELGQGRGDEHESGPLETVQTFAAKLRAAGYQEPMLPAKPDVVLPQNSGVPKGTDSPLPVVSREGFRAGVLSAIAGGLIIAGVYLVWGIFAACLFAAVCVGFVAGALVMQEWK